MLWLRIARRYLFSPKSHSVINIIASVSVVAVAIPAAAMVILLAIFNGLSSTIDDIYSAVDADIEIIAARGTTFHKDDISLSVVRGIEGVECVAPYIEQSVMLASAGRRTMVELRGIDSTYHSVLPIEHYLSRGDISTIAMGDIVLGSNAASHIVTHSIGCEIDIYALNRREISTLLPMTGITHRTTHLGGVATTNAEIDETLALYDLERAQQLLNYKDRLSGVVVRLKEGARAESVKSMIEGCVGEQFKVRTRSEKSASMSAIIDMERYTIQLIGALIALVASFSIVGSVIMLITDKRRDIATLRAMGASSRLVHRIFVGEGMLLTILGTVIGVGIGSIFSLGQQHYGWIKIYGNSILESFPIDLQFVDTLTVVVIYITLGVIVSYTTVRATLKKQGNV